MGEVNQSGKDFRGLAEELNVKGREEERNRGESQVFGMNS